MGQTLPPRVYPKRCGVWGSGLRDYTSPTVLQALKGMDFYSWNGVLRCKLEQYSAVFMSTYCKEANVNCRHAHYGSWQRGGSSPQSPPSAYATAYGVSLSSLSLASSRSGQGDFPIQSSTWQVKVNATGSSRAPQYCTRIRSMRGLSMCPSSNLWRLIHEGLWT